MVYSDFESRLNSACFAKLGEDAILLTPEGTAIQTRVIVDERTYLRGALGDEIDPRPSGAMPVQDVGDHPRGTLTAGSRQWTLGRPVDGKTDRYMVEVWLEPR